MKIVVDTNIVFSAILNSSGNIGKLLIHPKKHFQYYSCYFLKEEIREHQGKLLQLTKLTEKELLELIDLTTQHIKFLNEAVIPEKTIRKAYALVQDIDENDTLFIALTIHLRGSKLWTGDKKLTVGLEKKSFKRLVSSFQLNTLLDQKEKKK
ncbi:hypothetical protein BH24BAC1_BH24BAC1_40990 [soil metagenome]